MRVLITGGAGFIGSNIAAQLITRGDEVILLDNFNDYYDPTLKRDRLANVLKEKNFALYEGDIRDSELLERIFDKESIDKVIHLAAMAGVRSSLKDPALYADVNVTGTVRMLEVSRNHGIKNFVYASSSSVYGGNTKVPFAESDPVNTPISPYAATKRATELLASTYSHLYGMNTTGLRFFTVYGPWGRPDMALFSFTRDIIAGNSIDVYNFGDMSRNFTYVDDIASGTIAVLDADLRCELMNIGGDKEETLMRFIELIEQNTGKKARKNLLPMQPGDVPKTVADITKLRALGWEPKTGVEEGIHSFVSWYKSYYSEA